MGSRENRVTEYNDSIGWKGRLAIKSLLFVAVLGAVDGLKNDGAGMTYLLTHVGKEAPAPRSGASDIGSTALNPDSSLQPTAIPYSTATPEHPVITLTPSVDPSASPTPKASRTPSTTPSPTVSRTPKATGSVEPTIIVPKVCLTPYPGQDTESPTPTPSQKGNKTPEPTATPSPDQSLLGLDPDALLYCIQKHLASPSIETHTK